MRVVTDTLGDSTSRPAASAKLALLIAALSAVGPFAVDTYLPSLPEMARTLGVSQLAVQQSLTAYMVPFALMSLWHGAISDALGRRRVVLWGSALFGVASILCAFATSIEWLIALRALQGMVAGAGMVVGRAIVRDLLDGPEAQRMMAHVNMAFAVAPAVAPIIGGWLHHWFGWESVFWFLGAYAGGIWVFCRNLLPETLPVERRTSLRPRALLAGYVKVLGSGRFLALGVASTCNFLAIFVYIVSAPVFLMTHLGVGETDFLWLFGPTTAGMLVGAWLSGRLAHRLSGRATIWIGYGIMGTAAAANVAMNSTGAVALPWAILPFPLYTIGMSMTFPSLTLLALDLFPERRGMAASCQSFIQTTGSAVTAAVLAPLLWGATRSLALGGAALTCAGFAGFLLFRSLRAPSVTPTRASSAG
jgi:DHA1 family bicyclomycin/chloramphenicol resistance-like MFS transporter